MPRKQPLTLAHPTVRAAKKKWGHRKERRRAHQLPTLRFEDYFRYFKTSAVPYAYIAKLAGLTRERIRQIYNKYFRKVFKGQSGMKRKGDWFRAIHRAKIKQAEIDFLGGEIRTIVDSARRAKCVVEGVPTNTPHGVLTSTVRVNGHLCCLHEMSRAQQVGSSKRRYGRTGITLSLLEASEAQIFYTHTKHYEPSIFVVPSHLLRKAYFESKPQRARATVMLPLQKIPVTRGRHALIDWWKHEKAWHVLPPK